MIYALNPVKTAQSTLERLAAIEVNASLQIGIEVVERYENSLYLIALGRHRFTSKSLTTLTPGKRYWVEMGQTREGIIRLERLHPQPAMFAHPTDCEVDAELLETLAQTPDPTLAWRDRLLATMAETSDPDRFRNCARLLLALARGIISLPITLQNRHLLLQLHAPANNRNLNRNKLQWYIAMENLGPMRGTLEMAEEGWRLRMDLFYPRSAALLRKYAAADTDFATIELKTTEHPIAPLWEEEAITLLDIKG